MHKINYHSIPKHVFNRTAAFALHGPVNNKEGIIMREPSKTSPLRPALIVTTAALAIALLPAPAQAETVDAAPEAAIVASSPAPAIPTPQSVAQAALQASDAKAPAASQEPAAPAAPAPTPVAEPEPAAPANDSADPDATATEPSQEPAAPPTPVAVPEPPAGDSADPGSPASEPSQEPAAPPTPVDIPNQGQNDPSGDPSQGDPAQNDPAGDPSQDDPAQSDPSGDPSQDPGQNDPAPSPAGDPVQADNPVTIKGPDGTDLIPAESYTAGQKMELELPAALGRQYIFALEGAEDTTLPEDLDIVYDKDSNTWKITFTMPANAVALVPAIKDAPTITAIGNVKVGHWSVNADTVEGLYLPGEEVSVAADPVDDQGRLFDHWEITNASLDTNWNFISDITGQYTAKFVMPDADVTVAAIYEEKNLTVTVEAEDVWQAAVAGYADRFASMRFAPGDQVTLLVQPVTKGEPLPSYEFYFMFDHWECDDPNLDLSDLQSTSNYGEFCLTTTFTMPDHNVTIRPVFGQPPRASLTFDPQAHYGDKILSALDLDRDLVLTPDSFKLDQAMHHPEWSLHKTWFKLPASAIEEGQEVPDTTDYDILYNYDWEEITDENDTFQKDQYYLLRIYMFDRDSGRRQVKSLPGIRRGMGASRYRFTFWVNGKTVYYPGTDFPKMWQEFPLQIYALFGPLTEPPTPPDTPDNPPDTPDNPPETPDNPPDTPDNPPETPDTPPETPDTPPETPDTPIGPHGNDSPGPQDDITPPPSQPSVPTTPVSVTPPQPADNTPSTGDASHAPQWLLAMAGSLAILLRRLLAGRKRQH
jgi:hypothetical protein